MQRRAFLLGTLGAGWLAARQQIQSLGTLAWVQADGLWIRDLPDGQARRLVAGATMSAPRFSPSGRWVLFNSEQTVFVVSREGGTPVRLDGERGQWWPDRDDLLVAQSTGLSVLTATNKWKAPARSIPAGRLPVIFSPDATEIAYADETGRGSQRTGRLLRVKAAQGGSPQAVVTERGNGIFPCRWMPGDGDLLYWLDPDFSGSAASDGLELFRVPAHGPAVKPRSLGVSTLVHMDFLSLAPGGGALAVTAGESRDACDEKRIARIAWPDGEVRYLTAEVTAAVSASWSPDGRLIAYSATAAVPNGCGGGDLMRRSLAHRRIWTIQAEGGSAPTVLTRDVRYRDEEPQWSSDGRSILFCRIDEARNRTVWLMRSDGGGAEQVSGPLAPEDPGNLDMNWFGYYGTINWKGRIDWHQAQIS